MSASPRLLVGPLLLCACQAPGSPEPTVGDVTYRLPAGGNSDLRHEGGGSWSYLGKVDGAECFRCLGDGGRIVIRDAEGRVREDWRHLRDGTRLLVIEDMLHLDAPSPSSRPAPR
ncbi:MAG TPA: hypothetical protein VKF62_04995 [Planctomycetota bacterium]|nr:hypothetical protein [Planctomycetota bacterium]